MVLELVIGLFPRGSACVVTFVDVTLLFVLTAAISQSAASVVTNSVVCRYVARHNITPHGHRVAALCWSVCTSHSLDLKLFLFTGLWCVVLPCILHRPWWGGM